MSGFRRVVKAGLAAARAERDRVREEHRLAAADRMIADTPELGGRPKLGDHLTTDPRDPRLGHGVDTEPVEQHDAYLVLSEEERAKGFVRPLRRKYVHVGIDGVEGRLGPSSNTAGKACGAETKMGLALCETYACDPTFYGATYCVGCSMHLPVAEFVWDPDGERVGS